MNFVPLKLKIAWPVILSRLNVVLALCVYGGALNPLIPHRYDTYILIAQIVLQAFAPNVQRPSGISRPVDSQSRSLTGNVLPPGG